MRSFEIKEQELIQAGGIHPAPWTVEGLGNIWRIVDSNGNRVIEDSIKYSVAKAIIESYNCHPIVILEDDVVY